MIRPGDVVRHPNFGTGTIIEVRHSGYDAKVDFFGCSIWVPGAKLTVVEQARKKPGRGPVPSLISRPRSVDFLSRQAIHSFRLGIVPDMAIREWTVGRDSELAVLNKWIEDQTEGSMILEGAYGSGKTHMLRYLSQQAFESNFAVSMVRFDPGQENSSFPFRLFGNIMSNLRVPWEDSVADIRQVFRDVIMSREHTVLDNHLFFGPFAAALREGAETERDWLGFMGEKVKSQHFPSSLDFTTVANVVSNLLTGISRFLVDDAGAEGLIVLIDEVETAEVRRYAYHWLRTLNFLRGLTLAANDDPELMEGQRRNKFGVRVGRNTGLVYSGHYPDVRYTYDTPTFLKVLLALTECRVWGRLREWKEDQPVVRLSPIDSRDLSSLFSKVAGVYCSHYGIEFPRHLERWVLHDLLYDAYATRSVRGFMKALIEVLDFVRHHPSGNLERLAELREF